MKKLFFIICLLVTGMVAEAQVNTTQTINSKLKLTNVPDGLVNDSLLVRGADKVVKKTAVSNLIGDFINDGATTIAPSQNAVFDALQGKVNTSSLTAGRIPYATDTNTLGDSNRLLWDNTSSYLEMNGNNFGLRFKETLNNSYVDIVNGGLGSSTLAFKSNYGSGKTLMTLLNPTGTNAAQLAIGDVTSIPAESQFYVYGGNNGANIDLRGKTTRDETNMDFEGSDWATSPNSLGFSYFGPNYSIGGTVMGYPKVKTGVMRFNNADNALIVSNNGVDVTPIRFGINDEEILNIDNEGLKMINDKSIYTSSFFLFDGPNGEYGNLQISDNQFFANSYSGYNIFGFSNQSGFNAFLSADGITGHRQWGMPNVDGMLINTGGTTTGNPVTGGIEFTGVITGDGEKMIHRTASNSTQYINFDYDTESIDIISKDLDGLYEDNLGIVSVQSNAVSIISDNPTDDLMNQIQVNATLNYIGVSTGNHSGTGGRGLSGTHDFTPNIQPLDYTQKIYVDKNRLQVYTVSTLPAGTVGDTAYVTDAVSPTYLGTLTGGGSVKCPVFFNGTSWVSH